MTQETTIDVQKAYWWTQNKRGDWPAHQRREKMRLPHLPQSHQQRQTQAARQMAGACDRHHPPLDTRQIRPRERGADGQGNLGRHHTSRFLAGR